MRSRSVASGPPSKLGGAHDHRRVPMLKDDDLVGAIVIYRQEVGRSPKSRSSWCRTSPPRPSSPSRTRGCSTSCASAPTISPRRWSSRPRRRRCSRSSAARPANLQPVFQAMLENATRICDAKFGNLFAARRRACSAPCATHGAPPAYASIAQRGAIRRPARRYLLGTRHCRRSRSSRSRHRDEQAYATAIPAGRHCRDRGRPDAVDVPMLKDDELIGAIIIYRQEVRPFTDKQIELVQTSPRRPSSPSRTRGCSTSCASAPTISPSRWSSRPRPPRC